MSKPDTCPNCGSENVGCDAVDIGVGTMYGPLGCYDCGWFERDEAAELIDANIKEGGL